jgi:hypothetical protein
MMYSRDEEKIKDSVGVRVFHAITEGLMKIHTVRIFEFPDREPQFVFLFLDFLRFQCKRFKHGNP